MTGDPALSRTDPRWLRGLTSSAGVPFAWWGRLRRNNLRSLAAPERLEKGLVLILPGIESESLLNHGVARGLADAGCPYAIAVDDWTTGLTLLFPYHLRSWRRNLRQAERIAARIVAYQAEYPGRPVHLIGHSGGGAIAMLALRALPAEVMVDRAILLAPALSPGFDLTPALAHTTHGLWNFYSPLDLIFCGAGTLLLGTIDGQLWLSAGMCGFRPPKNLSDSGRTLYAEKVRQIIYAPRMAGSFNLGGHFGCTNRVFVAEWVAPLLKTTDGSCLDVNLPE